jgi:hypothetical protein
MTVFSGLVSIYGKLRHMPLACHMEIVYLVHSWAACLNQHINLTRKMLGNQALRALIKHQKEFVDV